MVSPILLNYHNILLSLLCPIVNVEAKHCVNMHSIVCVTRRELRYAMVSARAFSILGLSPS